MFLAGQLNACNRFWCWILANALSTAAGLADQMAGVFGFGFSTLSCQKRLRVDGICGSNFDSASSIPNLSHAAAMLLRCMPKRRAA
jgi:hypothetical protein